MFERIVVPLDGSDRAETVLTKFKPLMSGGGSEVVVVQAVELVYPFEAVGSDIAWQALWDSSEKYVQDRAGRLRAEGVRARGVVRAGSPANVILDVATEERATVIVMTTHGRAGLARWALGSVAEKVVRASDVPVLLERSFPPPGPELRFKKILVPIDAGPHSLQVVPHVAELARLFHADVSLLHVREKDVPASPPEMATAAKRLEDLGVRVESVTREGDPASQILEECRRQPADLIAMSTHGRSGPTRWVLGSVAEKVLRAATVPMLLVRGGERSTVVIGA